MKAFEILLAAAVPLAYSRSKTPSNEKTTFVALLPPRRSAIVRSIRRAVR